MQILEVLRYFQYIRRFSVGQFLKCSALQKLLDEGEHVVDQATYWKIFTTNRNIQFILNECIIIIPCKDFVTNFLEKFNEETLKICKTK